MSAVVVLVKSLSKKPGKGLGASEVDSRGKRSPLSFKLKNLKERFKEIRANRSSRTSSIRDLMRPWPWRKKNMLELPVVYIFDKYYIHPLWKHSSEAQTNEKQEKIWVLNNLSIYLWTNHYSKARNAMQWYIHTLFIFQIISLYISNPWEAMEITYIHAYTHK